MELGRDITKAAQLIREGKLVAFPTETVYGLGADALNPLAVAGIFQAKERPSFDPLIVHIADLDMVDRLVLKRDSRIDLLAAHFWPGPLTIVVEKSKEVPDIVTSGMDTVGVRMPDSTWALELIRQSGCPIAAPSANKFGKLSPTKADHVRKGLPEIDYILDGGETTVGIESTIIRLSPSGFVVLRPGVITREEIENYVPFDPTMAAGQNVEAPGMMHSHYSPDKTLLFDHDFKNLSLDPSRAAFLSFKKVEHENYGMVIAMAPDGELRSYAVRMFAVIHDLQESQWDYIVVESLPEIGIGIAIMDRLKKAAYDHLKKLGEAQ